jgi:DNA (cytosine-5)-methyltransferase 1
MRHLDLFSGIGGFALAAQWVWGSDHEILAFCEIDEYCQKVLKKHWPAVHIIPDIREMDGKAYKNVDLLTGGFPCQPFSVAGQQTGKRDDRYLWPEMARIIKEARPCWVIAENVPGIIKMELDTVLSDLEGQGYEAQAFVIPACAKDAPHRRDRVWIVANSDQSRTGDKTRTVAKQGGGSTEAGAAPL